MRARGRAPVTPPRQTPNPGVYPYPAHPKTAVDPQSGKACHDRGEAKCERAQSVQPSKNWLSTANKYRTMPPRFARANAAQLPADRLAMEWDVTDDVPAAPPGDLPNGLRSARTPVPARRHAGGCSMWKRTGPGETGVEAELTRINGVLPLFSSGELAGLADYLERCLLERLARLPQRRGPAWGKRARTRLPIRAAD